MGSVTDIDNIPGEVADIGDSNNIPDDPDSQEFVASVESYFSRGLQLGDVLDKQLIYLKKVTRATDTNWKWRKMAERWRHATIKGPSREVVAAIEKEREAQALLQAYADQEERRIAWDGSVAGGGVAGVGGPGGVGGVGSSSGVGGAGGSRRSTVGLGKSFAGRKVTKAQSNKLEALSLMLLRVCAENDKMVDTLDLVFDPYDPKLRYTPVTDPPEPSD